MLSAYKQKIMNELSVIPDNAMPNLYRILHLLTSEFSKKTKKQDKRGSLKGIWKGSAVEASLFSEAKKALFPYEYK